MRHLPMIRRWGGILLAAGALTLSQFTHSARADNDKSASMVIDYATGRVLHSEDADELRHPASLTKMMTLYVAFEAVEQGRLKLDQRLPVSEFASLQAPTKLGLKAGNTIAVRDAMMGLVTKSANDAAVVLAEALGGSETNFGRIMTQKARRLGMSRSTFVNASGLPDPNQISTARDMVTLGRALIRDFPQFYPYFATRSFTYGGRVHDNHNHLMKSYDGMDGIKTGFIRASGFNLVASAKRGNVRLVAAVFGGTSPKNRDDYMARLLDTGFGAPARTVEEPLVAARQPAPPVKPAPAPALMAAARPAPAPTLPAAAVPVQTARAEPAERPVQVTPVVNRMGHVISNQPIEDENDHRANARLSNSRLAAPPSKPGAKPLPAVTPAPVPAGKSGNWIIQVGSFSSDQAARVMADRARGVVGKGGVTITRGQIGGTTIFRSRLGGFDETAARSACASLQQKQISCVALGPNSPML
jgi:D-alanyl-D-alanine carboxypeptidase